MCKLRYFKAIMFVQTWWAETKRFEPQCDALARMRKPTDTVRFDH